MEDFNKEIQEKQAERKLNILKGFIEYPAMIEKAVYSDTPENKKLGRVGKTYGKTDDKPETKETPKKEESKSVAKPDTEDKKLAAGEIAEKSVKQYASGTSTEDLTNYIKKNPKGEHVAEAKAELSKRK